MVCEVPLTGQLCIAAKGTTLIRDIQAVYFCAIEFGTLPLQEQQARFLFVGSKHTLFLLVTFQLLGEYPLVLEICYHSGLVGFGWVFFVFWFFFFSVKPLLSKHSLKLTSYWCGNIQMLLSMNIGGKSRLSLGMTGCPFSALIIC